MALALRVQRLVAAVGAGLVLFWGAIVGSPLFGLWVAVLVVALVTGGIGGLTGEYYKQRTAATDPRLTAESNLSMLSGFGYLVVAIIAAFVPTLLAIALLIGILVDFGADHHVARSQLREIKRVRV